MRGIGNSIVELVLFRSSKNKSDKIKPRFSYCFKVQRIIQRYLKNFSKTNFQAKFKTTFHVERYER